MRLQPASWWMPLPCQDSSTWPRIQSQLNQKWSSLNGFLDALKQLHRRNNMNLLQQYFTLEGFDASLATWISQCALRLPQLFPSGSIPRLHRGQDFAVSLSETQVSCLLVNAFFGTFRLQAEDRRFHEFSMVNLVSGGNGNGRRGNAVYEKLKCIMHYFRRCMDRERAVGRSTGIVTFHRKVLPRNSTNWLTVDLPISSIQLEVFPEGRMEDGCMHRSHVDFANKYIGGGALGFVSFTSMVWICDLLFV